LFFCLILSFYSPNHIFCKSENESNDNIEDFSLWGNQGDAPPDADIISIAFFPSLDDPDSITIWLGIVGDFERGLTEEQFRYKIYFYENEFQNGEEYLGYVALLTWMDNKTIDVIFANPDQILIFHSTFMNVLKDCHIRSLFIM